MSRTKPHLRRVISLSPLGSSRDFIVFIAMLALFCTVAIGVSYIFKMRPSESFGVYWGGIIGIFGSLLYTIPVEVSIPRSLGSQFWEAMGRHRYAQVERGEYKPAVHRAFVWDSNVVKILSEDWALEVRCPIGFYWFAIRKLN